MASHERRSLEPNSPTEPARKSVIFGIVVLAAGVIAGVWYFRRPAATHEQQLASRGNVPASARAIAPVSENHTEPVSSTQSSLTSSESGSSRSASRRPSSPAISAPANAPPRPQPTPYTRALLSNLSNLDLSRGTLSAEQAQFWKGEYEKLLKEGPEAVPAIREFLEKNADVKFPPTENGDSLGVPSLRFAMFEALRQIGGPDAMSLAAEVMQTTIRPEEIALLARNLEASAPDQYRDAAVAAARFALARATPNMATVDTSPLFEVLQKFGGTDVLPDLENASAKWNYYSPIVLASLPDGAGISSLVRMAQNVDGTFEGSSRFALRMLAEVAPQYPDAAQGLLEQVRNNKVPNSAWLGIASALGGEQTFYGQGYLNTIVPPAGATEPKTYHLAGSNQNFNSMNVSPTWTTDQFIKQIAFIDQLRAANPTAATMLENVRAALAARVSQ